MYIYLYCVTYKTKTAFLFKPEQIPAKEKGYHVISRDKDTMVLCVPLLPLIKPSNLARLSARRSKWEWTQWSGGRGVVDQIRHAFPQKLRSPPSPSLLALFLCALVSREGGVRPSRGNMIARRLLRSNTSAQVTIPACASSFS
jgi:hypothetical protein